MAPTSNSDRGSDGSTLTSSDAGEVEEKPFLRREEFICSTAHNAHLAEDFLEDKSRLFGRPLPVASSSRSRSSTPAGSGGLKHVSSERLLRKFFGSTDTQSLRSIPDGVVPAGTFLSTVREGRRQSSRVGGRRAKAAEAAIDPLPQKPPRKTWRRSKRVRSTEKSPVRAESVDDNGGISQIAKCNGSCPYAVQDSLVLRHQVTAVPEEEANPSLSKANHRNPHTNEQLENDPSPEEAKRDEPSSSRRSSRLVRRNSTRRPLSCNAPEDATSKLYNRASLTHSRLPGADDGEAEGPYDVTANGTAPRRPRRIKRESLIHPPQPPNQEMQLGTHDLSQPVCINGRYTNPWPTWSKPSWWSVIRWKLHSKNHTELPSSEEEIDKLLPILPLKCDDIERPPERGIRVTWMGHATTLVQFDGLSVLTDPMMSDRASPTSMFGPKRFRRFPGSVHDFPQLDAVVISHNHYDHLDYDSVVLLNARFGDDLHWFVPVGLASWMRGSGCRSVTELSWWEVGSLSHNSDTSFVFTPAQHWSKRSLSDDNKSLWGSWCILGPQHRFFFAGDTGYCTAFKEIGEQYGPFDLAAIPIGAYEPRSFMGPQHVDPGEAVQIHQDVRAKRSIGIHWGTFALAHEYYLEPPEKLAKEAEKAGLNKDDFFVLKHGESSVIGES